MKITQPKLFLFLIIVLFCSNICLGQPTLNVEGVSYDKRGKSCAIVNGRMLKEGEEIDGAKITKIEVDSVTFQYGNEVIEKSIGQKEEVRTSEQGAKGLGKSSGSTREHYKKASVLYDDAVKSNNLQLYNQALNEARLSLKNDVLSNDENQKIVFIMNMSSLSLKKPELNKKEVSYPSEKTQQVNEEYNKYMQKANSFYSEALWHIEKQRYYDAKRSLEDSVSNLQEARKSVSDKSDLDKLNNIDATIASRVEQIERLSR